MPRSQRIIEDAPEEPWAAPLPPAVQRQAERANQLIANPEALAGEVLGTSAEGEAASAPESQPPPGEALPAESLDSAAAPAAPDWEQRFNTLQGKYNSEINNLQTELRVLRELSYDRNRPPPPEQIPPPNYQPAAPSAYDIPAEDIESFGQELITASQRWAAAQYQPVITQLEQRLQRVEQGNQQLNLYSVTQNVERELHRLVGPDWERINKSPDFLSWLAQIDPFSGRTRQSMINEAYGAGDANRTAYFFQAYQREHTAVTPAPAGRLEARPEEGPPAAPQPLIDLVVPGRAPTAPLQAPGAPTKRMWTRDEINAFYRSKQRGFWRGREAEAERVEADLIAAQNDGRLRQ